MSAIIIPRRWERQPQGAIKVDTDRWPTLLFAFLGSKAVFYTQRGIVFPTSTGLNGNPVSAQLGFRGQSGLATQFWPNTSGANAVQTYTAPFTRIRSLDFTAILEVTSWDTGYDMQVGYNNGWQLVRMTSADVKTYYEGTTPQSSTVTINFSRNNLGVPHRAVGRKRGNLLSLFTEDGNIINTPVGDGGNYQPNTAYSPLIGTSGRGYCPIGAFFESALTDDQCQDLFGNPWQIFKPRREVLYFTTASTTIPTLSSPGATNILTTSATPQVTLTF